MKTEFSAVYNCFLSKITDDLWELSEQSREEVENDWLNLLLGAIPNFEFPRKNLSYDIESLSFNAELTAEEINILGILMELEWLQRQIASIENIRMKYSGNDFKFTSQANHLSKLLTLLAEVKKQSNHMQRLYKRRKIDSEGKYVSNWSIFNTKNG